MINPIIIEDPAHFDCASQKDGTDQSTSITLLDLFALGVITGLSTIRVSQADPEADAAYAYKQARALLKERSKV